MTQDEAEKTVAVLQDPKAPLPDRLEAMRKVLDVFISPAPNTPRPSLMSLLKTKDSHGTDG